MSLEEATIRRAAAPELSFNDLVEILIKRSDIFEKLLGDALETIFLWDIAKTLHNLQEQYEINLKKSDVDELRDRFLSPKAKKSQELLYTSLDCLQILQDKKPFQKRPKSKRSQTTEAPATPPKETVQFEYHLDRTYGFVVLQGDHHTIALGTFETYEILHDKYVRIANKHGRGGQSQNRFARLAEQSRILHLDIVFERMAESFYDAENNCLVEKVLIAGPGPMKLQLLEHVPERWLEIIDPNPVTLDHTGSIGMHELAELMKAKGVRESREELQRTRQRMRKEGRKDQKGQQRGGGRKERQEEAKERKKREEEERVREEEEEREVQARRGQQSSKEKKR